MTNHEIYQNAMDKVTPSEAWQQDTLAKLAAARAEAAAPAPRTIAFRPHKKAVLSFAAVAACAALLIPTAVQMNGKFAAPPAQAAEDAVLYSENTLDSFNASSPEEDSAPVKSERPHLLTGSARRSTCEPWDDALYSAPVSGDLPQIVWKDAEISAGSGSLSGGPAHQNPTYGLSQEELPDRLPVWEAPAGPENHKVLLDRLENTADYLGLVFVPSPIEALPDGYPFPELYPEYVSGFFFDPDSYDPALASFEQKDGPVWNVNAGHSGFQLSRPDAVSADGNHRDPDTVLESRRKAAEQFGPLIGLEHPSTQLAADTNLFGEVCYDWFDNRCFEQGQPEDPIDRKLLNYSFRWLSASLAEDGELCTVNLSAMPDTPMLGNYPLRSLEDAKHALDLRLEAEYAEGWLEPAADGKLLSSADVTGWQLDYVQDFSSAYIQPAFTFFLNAPATEEDTKAGQTLTYRVSALPKEYCIPFEDSFN